MLISLLNGIISTAQVIQIFPPDESLPPKEYAESMTKTCGRYLGLDTSQKKQLYDATYQKKKTEDSLVKNGVHMEPDQLWALYNSLDDNLKQILTETQYRDYQHLQNGIYRIETKKKR